MDEEKPNLMLEIGKEEMMKVKELPYLQRCGRRLESNNVIVRVTNNGQYHATIPKAIASAIGLKRGSILKFEIQAYGGIKLTWKNPLDRDFQGGR